MLLVYLRFKQVKMAGHWSSSFVLVFMERDEFEVTKNAKTKEKVAKIQTPWLCKLVNKEFSTVKPSN